MTSSAIAALFPEPNKEGIVVREGRIQIATKEMHLLISDADSWNEEAIKGAWNPDTSQEVKGVFCYAASKTEAEKAAWNWVEQNTPDFQFNTILPDFTVRSAQNTKAS